MEFKIVTIILLLLPLSTKAQQCHVETACIDANMVNVTLAQNYNECLQFCQAQNDPQCNYFTYNISPQNCFMFSNCPTQSESQCNQDCFSGERACQQHLGCNIQGLCIGVYLGHQPASSSSQCLDICKNNPSCNYSTFYPNSDECYLYSQCNSIDDSCSNCVTNSRDCSVSSGDFNLIFVVGSGWTPYTSEILDLSGEMRTCPDVEDFPNNHGAVSAYIDNKIMACGGNFPYPNKCYNYEPQTNQWEESTSMNYDRYCAQSLFLDQDTWWITGDYNNNNGFSTEVYFPSNDSFQRFADLPLQRSRHNLVRLDETSIMLLGDYYYTSQVFLFDQQNPGWTQMPNSLVQRKQPMAGMIKFSNGSQFVVLAGGEGEDSTELFSLETQTWKMGPRLPYDQRHGGCVAQTDETFYMLGGAHSWGQDILKFDLVTEDWVILPEKLKYPRDYAACTWVPNDYVTCT